LAASESDSKTSAPSCSANQTGVGTAVPSRRNVITRQYSDEASDSRPASAAGASAISAAFGWRMSR
jgi:hypothetical protein